MQQKENNKKRKVPMANEKKKEKNRAELCTLFEKKYGEVFRSENKQQIQRNVFNKKKKNKNTNT